MKNQDARDLLLQNSSFVENAAYAIEKPESKNLKPRQTTS